MKRQYKSITHLTLKISTVFYCNILITYLNLPPPPILPAFWLLLHLAVYLPHPPSFSAKKENVTIPKIIDGINWWFKHLFHYLIFWKWLNLLLISSHLRLPHTNCLLNLGELFFPIWKYFVFSLNFDLYRGLEHSKVMTFKHLKY